MPFPLSPLAAGKHHLLTAEQLKDVVCTTALFLVVREEWGGVGRKRR